MIKIVSDLLKQHGAIPAEFKPSVLTQTVHYGPVPGAGAVSLWQALRKRFDETGIWPIIRGEEGEKKQFFFDLAKTLAKVPGGKPTELLAKRLKERIETYGSLIDDLDPNIDLLTFATEVDAAGIMGNEQKKTRRTPWPKVPQKQTISELNSIMDFQSRQPYTMVNFALITLEHAYEAPAHLGFGGWNDAPKPELQVAMLREWNRTHGALPIAITNSVLECFVERPPKTEAHSLALARDQWIFCDDIVSQGTQSIRRLAIEIWRSPRWFFWWD